MISVFDLKVAIREREEVLFLLRIQRRSGTEEELLDLRMRRLKVKIKNLNVNVDKHLEQIERLTTTFEKQEVRSVQPDGDADLQVCEMEISDSENDTESNEKSVVKKLDDDIKLDQGCSNVSEKQKCQINQLQKDLEEANLRNADLLKKIERLKEDRKTTCEQSCQTDLNEAGLEDAESTKRLHKLSSVIKQEEPTETVSVPNCRQTKLLNDEIVKNFYKNETTSKQDCPMESSLLQKQLKVASNKVQEMSNQMNKLEKYQREVNDTNTKQVCQIVAYKMKLEEQNCKINNLKSHIAKLQFRSNHFKLQLREAASQIAKDKKQMDLRLFRSGPPDKLSGATEKPGSNQDDREIVAYKKKVVMQDSQLGTMKTELQSAVAKIIRKQKRISELEIDLKNANETITKRGCQMEADKAKLDAQGCQMNNLKKSVTQTQLKNDAMKQQLAKATKLISEQGCQIADYKKKLAHHDCQMDALKAMLNKIKLTIEKDFLNIAEIGHNAVTSNDHNPDDPSAWVGSLQAMILQIGKVCNDQATRIEDQDRQIQVFCNNQVKLKILNENLKGQIEATENVVREKNAELSCKSRRVEELNETVLSLAKISESTRIALSEERVRCDSVKSKLETTKQTMDTMTRESLMTKSELEITNSELKTAKQTMDTMKRDSLMTKSELEITNSELKTAKQTMDIMTRELLMMKSKLETTKCEFDIMKTLCDTLKDKSELLETQNSKQEEIFAQLLNDEKLRGMENLATLSAEKDEAIRTLTQNLTEMSNSNERMNAQIDDKRSENFQLKSEVESLRQKVDDGDEGHWRRRRTGSKDPKTLDISRKNRDREILFLKKQVSLCKIILAVKKNELDFFRHRLSGK